MTEHLYRRPNGVWVFRAQFRDPTMIAKYGRKTERSLGTHVKAEAQLRAEPLIREHRLRLMEAQNLREKRIRVTGFAWRHPLGDRTEEDGTRVFATEQNVIWIKDGRVVREERNEELLVGTSKFDRTLLEDKPKRPGPTFGGPDGELFRDWIAERKPSKYILAEAEKAFALFKQVNDGLLFKDAYRPDSMKMVAALQAEGKKNATVNKHVSHLRSVCSLGMINGKLKHNCFARIALDPKEDALVREPFTEDQMALVRKHLDEFEPELAKLWTLLATTGMRLSEPFDITREHDELGIRKVRVGTKTESSDRWIPLPAAYLERYPEKIEGPLFTKDSKTMGKDLIAAFRALGIKDEKLVNHSLRHRAKDRLRAMGCPAETQDWICGHEEVTVSDSYGKGPPMSVLKPWIDKIGY